MAKKAEENVKKCEPRLDDVGIPLYDLPNEDDPSFLPLAVKNVIAAFEVFQADGMALDYVGIEGKNRQRILKYPGYRQRTRIARAKKYLMEIREIEQIAKELDKSNVDEDYDIRDKKQKKERDADFKTLFGMKLKASEMRRNLLNLSRDNENEGKVEGLEISFVPITREEWLALETTELHEGTADGDWGGSEEIGGIEVNALAKKAAEMLGNAAEEEASGGFKVNADGTVEDF